MIRKLQIEDVRDAGCVLAMQIPSYMVEAELIGFFEIPPLKDSLATLMQCGETFYGYFIDEQLAGAISYKMECQVLDIYRMMVHPSYFRRGIARSLIGYIEHVEDGIEKMLVSTGTKNIPAKQLYASLGFVEVGEREVAEGVYVTLFEKMMRRRT